MDYKEEAGRRLKAARESVGLSQKELAHRIPGLKPSRAGNYEQGTRYVGADPEMAAKIAKAIGVRHAFLMAIDDEDSLTADERALLEKYRTTDPRGKRAIQSIADSQPSTDTRDGKKSGAQ